MENSRNGISRKTLQGDVGTVEIEVPRDRSGTFEPKIIPKHERRFRGFRRQDPIDVLAWDVDAGYSGAFGADLRGRSESGLDQPSHRFRNGRRTGVAETAPWTRFI